MKKKILMKHILAALTMAAMVPIGQAWAEETYTKDLGYGERVTLSGDLSQYTDINIRKDTGWTFNMHATEPALWADSSVDLSGTNFVVQTESLFVPNVDALRVRAQNANIQLGNFKAIVNATNSDALTIGDESINSAVSVNNFEANVASGSGIRVNASKYGGENGTTASVTVNGKTDITITGNAISSNFEVQKGAGVYAGYDERSNYDNDRANVTLKDDVKLQLSAWGGSYGLWAGRNGYISVEGKQLTITADAVNSDGIAATNTDYNTLTAGGDNIYGSHVVLNGGPDSVVSINMNGMENSHAIYVNGENTEVISGKDGIGSFEITGDIAAENSGKIDLHATDTDKTNSLTGDLTADGTASSASFITDNVLFMEGNAAATNGGNVALSSGRSGSLYGALTASGKGSEDSVSEASMRSGGVNYIISQSVIDQAGGLGSDAPEINSALYAEGGGQINLTGSFNYINADYFGESDKNYSRRAVWAYNGADINITGGVQIKADYSAQDDPTGKNSTNMAIVAGTATDVTSENVNDKISDRAAVTVNYDSESAITGDIVSAYAGQVDIQKREGAAENAKINITGNLLAGNNGILNVDLGNGGTLTGRADDYGDAGVITDSGHTTFFDPAFSSTIYKGGAVNLKMGAGSTWNVTGQSWITSIDTNDAAKTEDILQAEDPIKAMENMATIDLVSANTDRNTYAHALTVYKMDGDAVFNMSLDGDRNVSDMLYMKKADGNYIINVVDPVTLDDMYAKRENGELFNGLRFATVGAGSNVTFRAVTVDQGVLNVVYNVGMDSYDESMENEEYNSTAEDGTSGNSEKPGDAMVDNFFGSDGTPVGSSDNTTSSADGMVLSEAGTEGDSETNKQTGAVNYKLMGRADEQISSAGKAIVAMSKVNYSNAVYMDRLNKRVGEARYLDGDDGLWVRLRHDRIGKEDAFRSMNTMMELGYEWKAKGQKDGEHRQGVAFDYMRGTADYTNVMGSGDVRRAGVWLYDTWLGDKGHYTDYVVKYGHLSNDFDIYAPTTADKISGDYNNDVWSVSAEYGRKKDIGSDWYFEPQAQLQYAYVTSADYTTSQGTKVKLDGIDSLIGRAGFRLGRDINEGNTVYFKADVLHEFLGDQKVHASDITGALDTTYENEGTWYDVGFGFSHRMGKDSYMFLDLEHSFGNDNDETYQINIGLSKAF